MLIEPALLTDANDIAAVHVQSWQSAYANLLSSGYLDSLSPESRAQSWHKVIENAESNVLLARAPSGIHGFVSFGRSRDPGSSPLQGEVYALYVAPSAWGRKVGLALLDSALTLLREQGFKPVSLWVFSKNERAISFYNKAGFIEVPNTRQLFELGGQQVEEVCLCQQNAA